MARSVKLCVESWDILNRFWEKQMAVFIVDDFNDIKHTKKGTDYYIKVSKSGDVISLGVAWRSVWAGAGTHVNMKKKEALLLLEKLKKILE